jgi:hypothetical protein
VTVIALVSSIIISAGSLAWGFAKAGFVIFARWILIFGAVWLFAQWRRWGWFSSLGLFFAVFVSVIGFWFGFSLEWLFSGTIFALLAWDMTDFRNRLRLMPKDDEMHGIERRHLARISLLALIGMALASTAMLVRAQFTFEWGILIVIVVLLGLGQWLAG